MSKGSEVISSSKPNIAIMSVLICALMAALAIIVDLKDIQDILGFSYKQVIVVLLIASGFIAVKAYYDAMSIDNDILSFRIISQFILMSYAIVSPIAVLLFDYDRRRIGYYIYKNFDYQRVAEVLFWFVLMQVGLLIGSRLNPVNIKLRNVRFSHRVLTTVGWILFLLSLTPYVVLAIGGNLQADTDYINTFVLLGEQSRASKILFYLGFFLIFPMFCVLVSAVSTRRYRHAVLMLGFIILMTVLKPSRGLLFTAILAVLLSYHYLVKKLKVKHGIIALVVLALLSIVLVDRRSGDSVERDRIDALLKIGEGSVVFENSYIIAKYLDDSGDFRWGRTYLTAVINMVPQWALPFKKQETIMSWFRHTFFGVITERTSGRMFSIVAEAYMNFMWLGPFLIGLIYSYFLKLFYNEMIASRDLPYLSIATLLYFYFCSTMYYFIRGDLTSFFVRTEAYVLLPLVILVVFRSRKTMHSSLNR